MKQTHRYREQTNGYQWRKRRTKGQESRRKKGSLCNYMRLYV